MIICAIANMTIIGTTKDKEMRKVVLKEFWVRMKTKDKKLYKKLRFTSPCGLAFIVPFYRIRTFIVRKMYAFYQKRLKIG